MTTHFLPNPKHEASAFPDYGAFLEHIKQRIQAAWVVKRHLLDLY